jgi:hypothetical protein
LLLPISAQKAGIEAIREEVMSKFFLINCSGLTLYIAASKDAPVDDGCGQIKVVVTLFSTNEGLALPNEHHLIIDVPGNTYVNVSYPPYFRLDRQVGKVEDGGRIYDAIKISGVVSLHAGN